MTDVTVSGKGLGPGETESLVRAVVAAENVPTSRIEVSYVGPADIRRFNREHRGRDKETDVLSYPFGKDFPQGSGGEVLVCPDVVEALAARDGRDTRDALRETVVHGVLHLLGHTDDTARTARVMAVRTTAILGGSDGP